MKPYQSTVEEVVAELKSDSKKGLTSAQVLEQRKQFGTNKISEPQQPSVIIVFLQQFRNPLIYILLIAASIIFFMGNHVDAFIISGVLFFNAIIGTVQEGRTRTLLQSLQHYITSHCVVIRDGEKDIIPDEQLVVGDIIVLQEGERIPADARLVEIQNIRIDESLLTGESEVVTKDTHWLIDHVLLADRKNMVFKGTYVVSGSGKAIVTATGDATEIGRLQKIVETIETQTPLQQQLEQLSHLILWFILGMCGVLLIIGLSTGKSFNDLLVMLTALFICVVPEGLPVVLTLVLVTGAYRMAQQKILVKKLQAVDTLGRTEVAVIDKTGTLTRNELVVCKVWTNNHYFDVSGVGYFAEGEIKQAGKAVSAQDQQQLNNMALAVTLMSRAEIKYNQATNTFSVEGDPTQAALSIFAQKVGVDKAAIEEHCSIIFDTSFDPKIRLHSIGCVNQGKGMVYILGSPESVFERIHAVSSHEQEALQTMLNEGLRVLALASKAVDATTCASDSGSISKALKEDFTLIGLIGIQDAIRPEVGPLVEQVRAAGLSIVMATGDHMTTGLYVARNVGIFQEGDEAVDGTEFNQMSQEELIRRIDKIKVYARLTPEQKLKLVTVFHRLGKTVAMTGDGVNDAPSLVAADVGIAMGSAGTEIAREAADVILLNDSFSHVIHAIEQGRHISYALRRVILYFFATNLGEIFVVLFALVLNLPVPILASQILWLNLVTDGFLDIALAMEPQEEGLLERKWLKKRGRLIDNALAFKMIYMALAMGIGTLIVFNWYINDLPRARTMALLVMAMFQWFNAWNCRSETKSIISIGLFSNTWLIIATVFVACLQYLVVTVPVLQTLFHTVPLTMHEFVIILAMTVPLFVIEECRKWVMRIYHQQ